MATLKTFSPYSNFEHGVYTGREGEDLEPIFSVLNYFEDINLAFHFNGIDFFITNKDVEVHSFRFEAVIRRDRQYFDYIYLTLFFANCCIFHGDLCDFHRWLNTEVQNQLKFY